jgi:ATP-dependent Clp protease ATP-binding subunit ClpA
MFERFTDRARQVVVLAQDEARRLSHNYIGTEHVLLGLLAEKQGVAARALEAAGVNLEETRKRVEAAVGKGKRKPGGHIPFTPRAKKVLELSLREALQMRHNYIGTEHILLGLVREGEGLGATTISAQGVTLEELRRIVVSMVPPGEEMDSRGMRRWLRRRGGSVSATVEDIRTTTATDASLFEARRLAGDAAVGSHHLLLAAISDPQSAAAKALSGLGLDLHQAREALQHVDVTGTADDLPEEAGRRQMLLRLTDQSLVLETTDPTLMRLAGAALTNLGPDLAAGGVIPGDHDASASLADVWQALHQSLEDITDRAGKTSGELHYEPDAG